MHGYCGDHILQIANFYVPNRISNSLVKFQLIMIRGTVVKCPLTYIRQAFDISVCMTWIHPTEPYEAYTLYPEMTNARIFKESVCPLSITK